MRSDIDERERITSVRAVPSWTWVLASHGEASSPTGFPV
jgi:hypothetical protein